MKLHEFLRFDDIVIQAHDYPDADAIASGYALYCYLKKAGKDPLFIYSGREPISKSNMVIMVKELDIPVKYITQLDHVPELLVTVDCVYGERNVTKFEAKETAVIDHHECRGDPGPMSEIRSNYGSCSSIMARMLADEGFNVNLNRSLATALYYGLYMDTVAFSEIKHLADVDLRDSMHFDSVLIRKMINSNLSRDEMTIAGAALEKCFYCDEFNSAVVRAERCDPNILGIIADMLLQVENVDSCVVYCPSFNGYKLSVRSCTERINAADFAAYITKNVGNGGGHAGKAGGFMTLDAATDATNFIVEKIKRYHTEIRIITPETGALDVFSMKKYRKKYCVYGYILTTDICPAGEKIFVRMLEANSELAADENKYLMIGVEGEVYPIDKSKFETNYTPCDELPDMSFYENLPTVTTETADSSIPLRTMIKGCCSSDKAEIYAVRLNEYAKVFAKWVKDGGYLYGQPGDYLVCQAHDHSDVYIIKQKIFDKIYEEAEQA